MLDEVVHLDERRIVCRYSVRREEELFSLVFRGHYPDFPLVPGVLICEMMFQAAGVLLAKREGGSSLEGRGTPLLTRIRSARFKRVVLPGELLEIHAEICEQVARACYFKGKVEVEGELAASAEFACILSTPDS
jgi:3-hydroxyacyl-[acyl-carrier-protein] dehydratase